MLLTLIAQAEAQHASQPGYDPRQTEKRFDALQAGQEAATPRSGMQVPRLARSEPTADTTPLVVLQDVALTGTGAISHEEIAKPINPISGKRFPKPILRQSPRRSATSIAPPAFT